MANPEKDLQDLLDALGNGQNLESILRELPDDSTELVSLIQLATQIRKIKHPEPSLEQTTRQQEKVMAAARDTFAHRRSIWKQPSRGWRFAGGLVGAIAILLAFIILAAAGSFAAITLHNWTTVEMVETAGVLQVLSQDQSQRWQTIQSGERMREGERIRTSTDTTALLRFPDGSLINLAPETEMSLVKVKRSWDGQVNIVLIQHTGETLHDVVTFETPISQYQVQTPSGTADVRGTNFAVTVDQVTGKALFSVNEGRVLVESAGAKVLVEIGQATITEYDMAPSTPSYGFQIKGTLSAIDDANLVIGNIQLSLSENIIFHGKPTIGEMARVAGHIDEAGQWWVDLLASSGGKFQASFTGILEATGETIWQVSGTSLLIDANTKLSGVMEIGNSVKVDFIVQVNGEYLATHIRLLDDTGEVEEQPGPTLPTQVIPEQTLEITPTATLPVTLTTPTIEDYCTGAEPHPTGVALAERYGVLYEEIMGWFCQGYGFGEIDLAYSLSQESGIPVSEIFSMYEAGQGWGNLKQDLTDKIKETKEPKIKEDK